MASAYLYTHAYRLKLNDIVYKKWKIKLDTVLWRSLGNFSQYHFKENLKVTLSEMYGGKTRALIGVGGGYSHFLVLPDEFPLNQLLLAALENRPKFRSAKKDRPKFDLTLRPAFPKCLRFFQKVKFHHIQKTRRYMTTSKHCSKEC